jgi:DNA-binding GntR family transcriptional regulator
MGKAEILDDNSLFLTESVPERDGKLGGPNYARAADAIRRDIIDGRFEDGEHLLTADLARRYGLSLAPIREALHRLTAEGIIVFEPKHGATVRAVTPAFLEEIYEIRLGLTPYLEAQRAVLASAEDVARMEQIEEEFEAAVAARSAAEAIRLNIAFHNAALSIRPNREALMILKRHHTLIRVMRQRYGFASGRLETVIEEHRRIIGAFRRRSHAEALECSRAHLLHAYEELRNRVAVK